jgi:hypothetical protein
MKKKTCLDCLYCKVSARSTVNCRLCFCSQKKVQVRHKEKYWLMKKLCGEFADMTGRKPLKFNFPTHNRRSLLEAKTNRK